MSERNPHWGRFSPETDRSTAAPRSVHKAPTNVGFGDQLTSNQVKLAERRGAKRSERRQILRTSFAKNRFCTQCGVAYNYAHLSIDNPGHIKRVAARNRCDACTDRGNKRDNGSRYCHSCGSLFRHQGQKKNARELVTDCSLCRAEQK